MDVLFVTSSRADFGLIRPIIKYAFQQDPSTVDLVCTGAASKMSAAYAHEGIGEFPIARIVSPVDREHLLSSHETATSLAHTCQMFSSLIARRARLPTWVFAPADRFEILGAVLASYYNNCPIAHIFGGDRSIGGHLDDNSRCAITKLAHVHFAVCEDSYQRILRLGEEPWRVFNVGSPVVESVRDIQRESPLRLEDLFQTRAYNVLCTYHPITTEAQEAGRQFESILQAFELIGRDFDTSFIITNPNNEHGSSFIVQKMESVRHRPNYYIFAELGWKKYLAVMSQCDLVIGNSSSGMLEAPILGVPSLDVGTRQQGRYCPAGVACVQDYDPAQIAGKMRELLTRERYAARHPYGEGCTSQVVYDILQRITQQKSRKEILQKKLTY